MCCFVLFFQEATIIPGDSHLFPDTDWLIGNHSDELTPWIPVIAARYFCRGGGVGWKELKKTPNKPPIITYVGLVKTVSFGSTPVVLVRMATFDAI